MPSILFNDSDPSKGKIPESASTQAAKPAESDKSQNTALVQKEDDFAIFPQWDVVPPNAIINPRLKKN